MSQTSTDDQTSSNEADVEVAEVIEETAETYDQTLADEVEDAVAHDDTGSHGSSFASTALKFLILVLVIFGLSLWLVPMLAPHLPATVAKHLMPGQQMLDERLAQFESDLSARAERSGADVAAMKAEIAALTERLAAAEAAAAAAVADAGEARTAAAASADSAKSSQVADSVVEEAASAATKAASAAETATTAATEAGKVASAASRDTASLARQMTSFEGRLGALADELKALGLGLAETPGSGDGATPELAAAFKALESRVEGLGAQIGTTPDFVTSDEAARFATQDDLRSARTALKAETAAELARFPSPDALVTRKDLDEVATTVGAQVDDLGARMDAAEAAAGAAQAASETAVGEVRTAIQDASLRSAVAAMTSRMENGAGFSDALAEIARLTGATPPDALSTAAQSGVATTGALQRTFAAAAQTAIAAEIRATAGDGVLDQAGARLSSVFAGRPKNEQEGGDAAAVTSRIGARLADGALPEALTEADALSDAARAAMSDWLDRLAARVGADAALSSYIAEVGGSQG